uniref:Multiple inositol polyphosphate phosphatase 1 n=1 Tax=Rhodosorus marinus TaxID=101924 RepID=A0A7S3A3R7_9RHOD|mmetsp:Transcript_43598/g.170622  ORF Transcript_43598/g.170622 Transcript_43598/m.170622 type:complete len:315 (+) Transcript_43598:444-1388(+)
MGRQDSPGHGLMSGASQDFGDETLHLNMGDGFSSDEDDTEIMHRYGGPQSPRLHPQSIWPVMFSMVAVVVVLGTVVVLSDIMESGTSQIDRACLDGFNVADHLGTDSPYPEPSETKWIRSKCNLKHVSIISRGGLKNPTETVIQDLDQLENWIHANIESEAEEVQWLKTWKNKYNEGDAGLLSIVGERSFRDIGRRMREIYARHLKVTQGDPILVRSTQDQRTSASAEAFLFGFFGIPWKNFTTVDNVSKGNDAVLKYTDRCHVFTELNSEVSSENSHQEELHLEKVARKVSKDLVRPNRLTAQSGPSWMQPLR